MGPTELEEAVHRTGRSMSRQRAAILKTLRETPSHPTAVELYDLVRQTLPRLTLATVYRNLHVLEELGLVRQIVTEGQATRFDADVRDHAHVRCLRCGSVRDVPVTAPQELRQEAARVTAYQIAGCRLLFEGHCPECQEAETASHLTEVIQPCR